MKPEKAETWGPVGLIIDRNPQVWFDWIWQFNRTQYGILGSDCQRTIVARINIEDSLFKDSRFMELAILLGDRHRALGAIVEAFMVAQEFFLNDETKRMIPRSEWKRRKLCDAVIEAGLAELRETDLIYICGSEVHFAWLLQCQEAGKRSVEARAKKTPTTVQRPSTTVQRPSTTVQRPSTTVQGPSTSYSSSSSSSKNKNNNSSLGAEEAAKKCLQGVVRFGSDDSDELRQWLGDAIFHKIRTTIGWQAVREMKRDNFAVHNLSKFLGG